MPTVLEMPIEKTDLVLAGEKINTGLISFDKRKSVLTELKNEATGLKVNGVEDKDGFLKVSITRKKLKAARVEIEKEAKLLRDHVSGISKNISLKEKELIAIISPSEDELQKEEDRITEEKLKIQQAKDAAEKARIQLRIDKLAAFGFGVDYSVVMSIDDASFQKVLDNAKVEHEKEVAAKAEEDRLAKIEQEKLIAEREELEELRKKQAKAQKIIDDQNEVIRKAQEEKEAALRAEQQKIEDDKKALELQKQKGIEDKKRADELAIAQKDAAEKALRDKDEAEQLAKIQEAEKLLMASDKVKFQTVINKLGEIKIPEMKSVKSKKLSGEVVELIAKITNHILNNLN